MTNLPATVVEAEAIDTVSQWVETVQARMAAEASREWLESTLRDFLMRDFINRMQVIEAAEAGDEIADAALARAYHSMMDRGEMPPASMIAYEARARLRGPIKRGRGRNTYDNWQRDIGIAVLVYLTAERFRLRPTRNPASKRKISACCVVASALGRARINVAEKRVENIWAGLAGQVAVFVARKMSPSNLLK
jgi:hypothetical protein